MLDDVDRRIVGALQVDGRAPWSRVARAIGEHERSVSRRATRLLSDGVVRVAALGVPLVGAVVGVRCEPGRARVAARSLANRPDTHYCHALTGVLDVVADVSCPPERLSMLAMDEIPAVAGCREAFVWPVLRYVRTMHQWRPGLVSAEAEALLRADACEPSEIHVGMVEDQDTTERTIVEALRRDARRSFEELARLTGLSEATVRRRLEQMRRSGRLLIRAVVDPAEVGYPAHAFLWLKVRPADVASVGSALQQAPFVRYAAHLASEYQFLIEVAATSTDELAEITTGNGWTDALERVEVSIVTSTFKRSGLLTEG
jgi:DNA-binding Lrp family transcriptional regulator